MIFKQKNTAIAIILGRVFQVLISILSLKFATYYLQPTEVAKLFLVFSVMNYFGLTLIGPIGQYINRQVHYWRDNNLLIPSMLLYSCYILFISSLSVLVLYVVQTQFSILSDIPFELISSIVFCGIIVNTIVTTIPPSLNLLGFPLHFVILSSGWLLFSLLISIGFITYGQADATTWFSGQITAQAIFSVISIYILARTVRGPHNISDIYNRISPASIREVLKFSFPLLIVSLFAWCANDSFLFITEKISGLEYLAFLSVGFNISQRASYAIESVAQQVFYPRYYKRINSDSIDERKNAWAQLFSQSIPAYITITAYCCFLSPFLVLIFSSSAYLGAITFVAYGAVYHLFRKVSSLASIAMHGERKTSVLILPYLVGAFCSTLGVYLWGSYDLVGGIPFIITLGSFGTSVLVFLTVAKRFSLQIDYQLIGMSIASCAPFTLALFFNYSGASIVKALSISVGFGAYFCVIVLGFHYYLSRRRACD